MSGTTKRLDLQFGIFACSVQGFDDPVQPVQQVLQALQHLLEETPELTDAGISFDADAIDRLVGEVARRADVDERNVDIVPGLIIVHRPGGEGRSEDESWSRPSNADEPERKEEQLRGSADDDSEPAFVNIFARGGASGAAFGDDSGDAEASGDAFDGDGPFAAEAAAPSRDIFSDIGAEASAALGDGIFADPKPADSDAGRDGGEAHTNLFAEREGDAAEDATGHAGNVFAAYELESATADLGESDGGEPETLELGTADDEPQAEATDEGYTAAGLAKAAGAESIAELMVSAAAWMVLLQGQTNFSRREVIDVFESIPGEHSKTLEARIKGFGKAVRNGQLIMVEDGVFGLSRAEMERFQSLL